MNYLGIPLIKPKVGFFDFTCCEGCQLQVANKEETLVDLLKLIDIVNFREISSDLGQDYEIAFIEGSITTNAEEKRLKAIRNRAKVLVAMGACACLGGVNNLKSRFPQAEVMREVYGSHIIDTGPVRRVKDIVKVDVELPGCPISKQELEALVSHVVRHIKYQLPRYPVCVECKQRLNSCVVDMGIICLGTITRAGCNAVCPRNKLGCWGCRGPVDEANFNSLMAILKEKGFSEEAISERLQFFNAFCGLPSQESSK